MKYPQTYPNAFSNYLLCWGLWASGCGRHRGGSCRCPAPAESAWCRQFFWSPGSSFFLPVGCNSARRLPRWAAAAEWSGIPPEKKNPPKKTHISLIWRKNSEQRDWLNKKGPTTRMFGGCVSVSYAESMWRTARQLRRTLTSSERQFAVQNIKTH